MMSGSGKGSSVGSGMGTRVWEQCPLACANPLKLQLTGALLTAQYSHAFFTPDLSPLCLFLFAILREVGGEQPSGSLSSGCLFGRRQIEEVRSTIKKLSLNGKAPSKKIKPQGAQVV